MKRNMKMEFGNVPGSFILDSEDPKKVYSIPIFGNPKKIKNIGVQIRVRNGNGSFHWSKSRRKKFLSKRCGHFWRIPKGAIAFCFPFLKRLAKGWHYGEPEWIF